MTNPYLNRTRDAGSKHGRKAERKTAKRLGGRLTPGSGSREGAKGDIERHEFLIECKATKAESISVKLDWLEKISREALDAGKTPALIIQFVDAAGNAWRGSGWVLVPERVFAEWSG